VTGPGKRKVPFNFSGSLASLPELHKALKLIHQSHKQAQEWPEETTELLSMPKSDNGVIDLRRFSEDKYNPKIVKFGDFAAYIEMVTFKGM